MIDQFTAAHPAWMACVAHLERVNLAHWVLDDQQHLLPDHYLLGVIHADAVIGHITLKKQPIMAPETPWSIENDHERALTAPGLDALLTETFVSSFVVDVDYRRQGHGRALQLAALDLTRALGCYQMRSWSSLDARANHALKLSLEFAVHPEIQITITSGTELAISGYYFVKTVAL